MSKLFAAFFCWFEKNDLILIRCNSNLFIMTVYVGNIAYSMTVEELKDIFEAFGKVLDVKIIIDRQTGRSKGYGFIEMENDEEALKAISALNDTQVKGRNIKVNNAHRKVETQQ